MATVQGGTFARTIFENNLKSINSKNLDFEMDSMQITGKMLSPSHYMENALETTCQWLERKRTKKTKQCFSDGLVFHPFPMKLVFKNFGPNSSLFLPLCFKNVDGLSRCLEVIMEESPFFKLIFPSEKVKIGPGLTVVYKVVFMPTENKDYSHYITYCCEGMEFTIPIIAVGPRAILDFPDIIDFTTCPVKYLSSKVLFIKNVGTCGANFKLKTNLPYTVSPKSGYLNANENMQITLNFFPLKIGNHCGLLVLRYETGEEVHIDLSGISDDVAVKLEKSSLRMDRIFMNMITSKSVQLLNNSNVVTSFKWSPFATQQEEEMNKNLLMNHLELSKMENSIPNDETYLADQGLEAAQPLFGGILNVDPAEGHVWPKTGINVNISFRPNEPGEWNEMIYCDVEGRETRLPLIVKGFVLGPALEFSISHFDMGEVCVSTNNVFEVVLHNRGPISVNFCVQEDISDLGSCFEITPSKGKLEQKSCQVLKISFCRNTIGPFDHIIMLDVENVFAPLKFNASGSVEGPSFCFDVDHIDFESVSLGFEKLRRFKITNLSPISLDFQIHIAEEFDAMFPLISAFQVEPSSGTLASLSSAELTIKFKPKRLQSYCCNLMVNVVNVKKFVFSLPIMARTLVPSIKVLTPTLTFIPVPLNFPVTKLIKLENYSDLSGKYILERLDTNLFSCFSSSLECVIEPLSCCLIPLTLIAKCMEEIQESINIYLLGSTIPLEIQIKCKGEGPVVTLSHEYLDWGIIPVLKQVSKSLVLHNHSPILARFRAHLIKNNGVWYISPMEGVIQSEEKMLLDVIVNLDDALHFSAHLEVLIENSSKLTCQMVVQGRGSTIMLDPRLECCTEFGPKLCNSTISQSYEVANLGRRIQSVTFKIVQVPSHKISKVRQKISKVTSGAVLKIIPSRLELLPNSKSEITVTCTSDIPCCIEKTVLCQAIVGTGVSKEDVGELKFLCHFVDPVIKLSTTLIKFEVYKFSENELVPQVKNFFVTNVSSVTIGMNLTVDYPFFISLSKSEKNCNHLALNMVPSHCEEIQVLFEPDFECELHNRYVNKKIKISFLNHTCEDYLVLQGSVYYPNLQLERSVVNFGCVLNDTEATECLTIFNQGPLPATYFWSFDKGNTAYSIDDSQIVVNSENEQVRNVCHTKDFMKLIIPSKLFITENKTHIKAKLSSEINFENNIESEEMKMIHHEKVKIKETSSCPSKIDKNFCENNCSHEISSNLIGFMPNLVQSSKASVEEAFHIEPMFGSLQAGESEIVTFVFHGYPCLNFTAKAICNVFHGPKYEISLEGESSCAYHEFSSHVIDYGSIHFNKKAFRKLELKNRGKVPLNFKVLIKELNGPKMVISPLEGSVGMGCTEIFLIGFCPGTPHDFQYMFEIQVAHSEHEIFWVRGSAVFPRIFINLPLTINGSCTHDKYSYWISRAAEIVSCRNNFQHSGDYFKEVQMEAELLMLVNHLSDNLNFNIKPSFVLQDYLIDFGTISLASIVSKTFTLANLGSLDVSFYLNDYIQRKLALQGIIVNFSSVCYLLPNCSTNLEVAFDPRNSNFELNFIREEISIHVIDGPDVNVSIQCKVVMPSLCLSENNLNFSEVLCGECKLITIQFFNEKDIQCSWSLDSKSVTLQNEREKSSFSKKCISSRVPIFDLIPNHGVLEPQHRINVQVKFHPKHEKEYQSHLVLVFEGSCLRQSLVCVGVGVDKKIEIVGQPIAFDPILPNSRGDVKSLVLRNPTCFPVEVYCLEMDEVYLMEEKMLRLLDGYDNFNNLLLPPRYPGESLPQELLDFYQVLVQEYLQMKQRIFEYSNKIGPYELRSLDICETDLKLFQENHYKEKIELSIEGNPIMNTLLQCAEIELKGDNKCLKKGIVIIVHGAPKSGKSSLAQTLATNYGAALLNIDQVITDAIERRSTPAGFMAYNMCLNKSEPFFEGLSSAPQKSDSRQGEKKHILKNTKISSTECESLSTDCVGRKCLNLKNGTNLLTTILPEDVVSALISERLMSADCLKGIVIDGLHSFFTSNSQNTALILARTIGKRPFIYAITLKLPFESFKMEQQEICKYQEYQMKAQVAISLNHLNEMSEDEFDNLTNEEKKEYNGRRNDFKKALMEKKKTEELEKRKLEQEQEEEDKQKTRKKMKGEKGVGKTEDLGKTKKTKVVEHKADTLDQHETKQHILNSEEFSCHDNCSSEILNNLALEQRFISFENEFDDVSNVLEFWDQTTPKKIVPDVDADQAKKSKNQNVPDIPNKSEIKEDSTHKGIENASKGFIIKDGLGVTHIIANITYKDIHSSYYTIMQSNVLPSPSQVLDILGLNVSEPDVPPPMTFSVVTYPSQRSFVKTKDLEHFKFVDDISNESLDNQEKVTISEDGLDKGFQESLFSQLRKKRWIVPALSEVILKLQFQAERPINVCSSLSFELLGNKKRYQISLSGLCCFPSICNEPRKVFPAWTRSLGKNEIVVKKYVLSKNMYYFGPLLVGKTRERYKECVYPENTECLKIINTSPFEAEVTFAFLNDKEGETFLLHPAMMILCPGEEKNLHVWAYPRISGCFEDSLVCCIKNNPEPLVLKLSCQGITPEIEFGSELNFGEILLHRKESKALEIKNKTLLPAAWKLVGLDELGKEFSVCKDEGLVPALSTYEIWFHFKAEKPTTILKKAVRMEVYDTNKIIGPTQSENILISAEAYDVAIDISFARGSSGGIDFGLNKVGEEVKQFCTLRNKGKYRTSFRFELNNRKKYKSIREFLSIDPISGLLEPNEKPITVQIGFFPKEEVFIKDSSILRCFVIDSKLDTDNNEYIASIPIRVSARSTWTKVKILPLQCLNFGAMAVGEKKVMQITISNTGENFAATYIISGKNLPIPVLIESSDDKISKKKQSNNLKPKVKKKDETKSEEKLMVGIFNMHPYFGVIEAGSHAVIDVECSHESLGIHKEMVLIHVPGIETKILESVDGISYCLMAEFCLPRIEIYDNSLIFEEHFIEKNLQPQCFDLLKHIKDVGFYKQNENKFIFKYLLVGTTSFARFKIVNIEKIVCSVKFSIKSFDEPLSDADMPAFDVSPSCYQIPPLGHIFATISFTPSSLKAYLAIFEAAVSDTENCKLTFELFGEGVLPHLRILKPLLRNELNDPILSFKRVKASQKESLPVYLLNEGTVDCRVQVDLIDPDNVFTLFLENGCVSGEHLQFGLGPGETINILVSYTSQKPGKSIGKLKLIIIENSFDETIIELLADSLDEDVYLQIPYHGLQEDPINKIAVAKGVNVLSFGECGVKESNTLKIEMVNSLSLDFGTHFRFEWQCDLDELKFSPKVGHLRADSFKEICVTFAASSPIEMSKEITCNLTPIIYNNKCVPGDWDDRLKVIKWTGRSSECSPTASAMVKTVSSEKEPSYTVNGDKRTITLLVVGTSQYCQYYISTKTIIFKDTPMLETKCYSFKITNVGKVMLKFNWDLSTLEDDTHFSSMDGSKGPVVLWTPFKEVGCCSFVISPSRGLIRPKEVLEFSVKFSPRSPKEFASKFICKIPNLEPGFDFPEIETRGRSFIPQYHFELECSSYLSQRSSKWLNPDLSDDHLNLLEIFVCDPGIKVIEFSAVGLGKDSMKRFFIINPTTHSHLFNWTSIYPEHEVKSPQFMCYNPSGCLPAGKRLEITFAFSPINMSIVESMWIFSLPELNEVSKFLMVGKSREPNIFCEKSHHNFGPVMVASKSVSSIMLLNHEDECYSYSIDPSSCINAERNEFLFLSPAKGVLSPRSSSQLSFEFSASKEGEANFNICVNIPSLSAPLNFNVKAIGTLVKASVSYSKQCGPKTILRSACFEEINFGEVHLFDSSVVNISIENIGSLSFDYTWHGKRSNTRMKFLDKDSSSISIKPFSGFLGEGETSNCFLVFRPIKKMTLKNVELELYINQVESYHIILKGSTISTMLKFSALSFDFGRRFLYEDGHEVPCAELIITNQGDRPASLNCLQQPDLWLSFTFEPNIINPQKSVTLKFKFYARETTIYHRVICFIIDENVTQDIHFCGEGIIMMLEVQNSKDKVINLGTLFIGENVRKVVPVCNNSMEPMKICLNFKPIEKDLLAPGTLLMHPTGPLLIPGCSCFNVDICFSPKKQIATFMESIMAENEYVKKIIFAITGAAKGFKLALNIEHINFGACVPGSSNSQSLILSNTGSISSRFHWDAGTMLPEFDICPHEGCVPACSNIHFKVTFNPQKIKEESICKVRCITDCQAVAPEITLYGECIPFPSPIEVISIQTTVRKKAHKTIEVLNPMDQSWILKPIINGEFYTGSNMIAMPPKSSICYEITYFPLVMTNKTKHLGNIFLPLPDGNSLVYNFIGTSDPPEAESQMVLNIPSRFHHTEKLKIENWLNTAQRFKVIFQRDQDEKTDNEMNSSPIIRGVDYIEIPALLAKEYQLSLFSYKQGSFKYKVIFMSKKNEEYIFYELLINFIKPSVINCICIESTVRQKKQHSILIQNPLMTSTTFYPSCTVEEIHFLQQFIVPGLMEKNFTFEYFPLKPGKLIGKLELNSDELGSLIYDLELRVINGMDEKAIIFQTFLGSKQSMMAKFINFAQTKTDYICEVEDQEFFCSRSSSAPNYGCEVSVEIIYQPSKIGTLHSYMTATSPHGGQYKFPLLAECLPPKPQGPFVVKAGSDTAISFTNVFKKTETFCFKIDNPLFMLNSYNETIQSLKEHRISIGFNGSNSDGVETSKLTISQIQTDSCGIQWIYYLKGISS